MSKNYYDILGLEKNASETDVKKAYRKLAQQYHPDKHKGDKSAEAKFKEVNEAYEVLSDKQKRSNYDTFGSAGGAGFGGGGGGAGGFNGQGFGGQGFDFSSFSGSGGFADIFETFFGGGGAGGSAGGGAGGGAGGKKSRKGPRQGEDIEFRMNVTFEEAVFGAEQKLGITKLAHCDRCSGTGAEPGSKTVSCPTCSGTGEIRQVRQTLFGQMATARHCPDCEGEGRKPERRCVKCQGSTRVRKEEQVKVKIPAGVDDDSTIRLSGKGEAGVYGGAYGDLYLHIRVEPSKQFERRGYDIHSTVHIHLLQAVLGDDIGVDTLREKISLKIPAGTQSGKVFRLKEYGVERLRGSGKGDHFVKIIVDIPEKLGRKERELYGELAKESGILTKDGGKKGIFS